MCSLQNLLYANIHSHSVFGSSRLEKGSGDRKRLVGRRRKEAEKNNL